MCVPQGFHSPLGLCTSWGTARQNTWCRIPGAGGVLCSADAVCMGWLGLQPRLSRELRVPCPGASKGVQASAALEGSGLRLRFGGYLSIWGYQSVLEDIAPSEGFWSRHPGCGIEQLGTGLCHTTFTTANAISLLQDTAIRGTPAPRAR